MLKADIKSMYLLMYYETEAYEQFYSVIDTFRHFLKNNISISDERKSIYSSFLNLASRLTGIKENGNKEKLARLKSDVTEKTDLINKSWLLEKIAVLEAK